MSFINPTIPYCSSAAPLSKLPLSEFTKVVTITPVVTMTLNYFPRYVSISIRISTQWRLKFADLTAQKTNFNPRLYVMATDTSKSKASEKRFQSTPLRNGDRGMPPCWGSSRDFNPRLYVMATCRQTRCTN